MRIEDTIIPPAARRGAAFKAMILEWAVELTCLSNELPTIAILSLS